MRWPRLPRRRDPHTVVITGIKSAVRAQSRADVSELLLRHKKSLALTTPEASELAAIIKGRVDDSVSHAEASEHLIAFAHSAVSDDRTARAWFTLENLSRTIGCFLASDSFTHGGLQKMAASSDASQAFLAHLHRRNVAEATTTWEGADQRQSAFWQDAGHYLWLWSGGQSGEPCFSPDHQWVSLVRGTPVTILGPAPTSLSARFLASDSKVARVIMQEVLEWDASSDPLDGQCDLAYASRETRNWLRENSLWSQLSRFDQVSFRVEATGQEWAALAPNLRSAHDPRRLMIGGSSANMIPLMVWDLLRVPEVSITVGGTTFFASQTAYTDTNRRFKHTVGKPTDATGSTGELFERCPTFARHNVTENLTLVSNLAQSGAISVDNECQRVIDLPITSYLSELDTLYGIDRR